MLTFFVNVPGFSPFKLFKGLTYSCSVVWLHFCLLTLDDLVNDLLVDSLYLANIISNTQGKTVLGGQVCQICGDNVGKTVDGEPFIACDVCAFPVCRPCYEYERKDGNQSCPQCKTRYKRHKGKLYK